MNYIKLASGLGVIAMLYALYWGIHHDGYIKGRDEVQAAWDKDKAERKIISDKQEAKAREAERVADEKTKQATADYDESNRKLAIALARLRDAEAVPRRNTVPVATDRPGSMPGQTQSPERVDQAAIATAGTRPAVEYGAAMSDTLQCSSLIAWVTDQGMAQ